MKLSISNSSLKVAVTALRGSLQSSRVLPATQHLLFRQEEDGVSVTAADQEVELVFQIAGPKMNDPGNALVRADKLSLISNNFGESDGISLICDEVQTQVKALRSQFKFGSLPADQFPLMDELDEKVGAGARMDVRADDLHQLLEKTSFSMAQNDARYYLNGLLLTNEGDDLSAVATDGHRLAISRIKPTRKADQDMRVVLPRRAVQELSRILPQSEDLVSIGVGEKQVRARFREITMTMKLIEGSKYPDYQRVIPNDFAHVISMESKVLRRTLAMALVAEEGTTRLCFSNNLLKMIARADQDEAEVEQEIEYDGEPFEVGFNPQYLREVLAAVESEQVLFEFKDPNSAVQIRESDSEATKYVVMPLRL